MDRNSRVAPVANRDVRRNGVRPWNRLPLKAYFRHFYNTIKGIPGAGVKDAEGKTYQIQRDGSLRRISPRRHEINKSL